LILNTVILFFAIFELPLAPSLKKEGGEKI